MEKLESLKVRIVSPSFKIPKRDLNQCLVGLAQARIQTLISKPLFDPKELCSNTLEKRLADLKTALNENNDLIWCLRGGYGCLHFIPDLLRMKRPSTQKRLIGFSDITVLHYFFNQVWNWPSLHWKHVNGFLKDNALSSDASLLATESSNAEPKSEKSFDASAFQAALNNIKNRDDFKFNNIKPLNETARKVDTLKAKVIGGNLITLQSLVGLEIPKPKGKFLFLEEVDEPVYKIDRALIQLEQNGWFKGIKGILLGSFTHKSENVERDIQKYLRKKAHDYKVPVFGGLKAGHALDQLPLFFNTSTRVVRDNNKFHLLNQNGFKGL